MGAQQRHSWTMPRIFGFLIAHLQLSCPDMAAFAAAAFTLSTPTSGDLDLPIEIHTAKSEEIGEKWPPKDSIFSLHGSGMTQQ